jgi:DNA-binding transcriptional regulator YhcF (GntR family)
MLLRVEPDGPIPIYQQIRDRVVEAIADGELPAGSPLPSTRQLAMDLGVNYHTVNKSYDILRQEGLVRLGRKSGAVVWRDPGSGPPEPGYLSDWAGRLRTVLAEAAAHGVPASQILQHCGDAVAGFVSATAPLGDPTPSSESR